MKKKVYVSEPIHPSAIAMLEEQFEVVQGHDISNIAEEAQGCSGILIRVAKITKEIMDAVPTLKVIAKHGIGVDNIDVEAATERGILVVNAPLSNINAVAEHTVALMLAVSKHLVLLDKATRENGFAQRSQYVLTELKGKTVGLVGLGKIARLVAKKLSAWDVELIGSDPFVSAEEAAACGIKLMSFEEVLERADFVSLHTPLTEETRKMMGAKQFARMKNSAVLINASRGPVVDEAALVQALKDGSIAGAALDVFDPEPPCADDPLFALDNVIVSPHNAALTDMALVAMAMDSATGIVDYLNGKVPAYPVNRKVLEAAAWARQ